MKKMISSFLLITLFTHNVWAITTCNSDTTKFFAKYDKIYYTCSNGEFLPANTAGCVSCPSDSTCSGGTFGANSTNFQGIELKIKNSQINNGCAKNFPKILIAVYDRKNINCSAGTYLPANAETCTQCPANYYCPGGLLTFDETTDQGINVCPDNQTSIPGSSSVDDCKTVNLNWISNGATYQTSTCTLNGLITLPETPTRPGYAFKGWKLVTHE